MPKKLAIIGCGAVIKDLYLPVLKKNAGNFEFSVCDIDLNGARQVALSLGTDKIYSDYHKLADSEKPDFAIIALPHKFHAEASIYLMRSGAHILCEKPMAINVNEADKMIQVKEETNKKLSVGLFRRYFPAFKKIKKIIESGEYGQVKSFHLYEGEEEYSWKAVSMSFFDKNLSGGGVLIDIGAHTMDIMLWFFGGVENFTYFDDRMGGIEANCEIYLTMENGAKGYVRLSRDCGFRNRYIVELEKATIIYNFGDPSGFFIYPSDRKEGMYVHPNLNERGLNILSFFEEELLDFVGSVADNREPCISGYEAKKSLDFIDRCYNNRRLMDMGWMSERELEKVSILNR